MIKSRQIKLLDICIRIKKWKKLIYYNKVIACVCFSWDFKGIKFVGWIILFSNIIFLWSQKWLFKLQDRYNIGNLVRFLKFLWMVKIVFYFFQK